METKDKQTLLADLCGRIPYSVKVKHSNLPGDMTDEVFELVGVHEGVCDILCEGKHRFTGVSVENIKPYLRPLADKTEEESKMIRNLKAEEAFDELIDYYNEKHLDYRKLIRQGLALEAPENMYCQAMEESTITETKPVEEKKEEGNPFVQCVGTDFYELILHKDNSAPCSYCVFLDRGTLGCEFPKEEYERRCQQNTGTHNGWNTREYEKISKERYEDVSREPTDFSRGVN